MSIKIIYNGAYLKYNVNRSGKVGVTLSPLFNGTHSLYVFVDFQHHHHFEPISIISIHHN